jgi:hypothetical protein
VPWFFGGRCAERICPLDGADAVFTGFDLSGPVPPSFAILGDFDGDAYDDIVLGEPLHDGIEDNSGAVRLFYGRDRFAGRLSVGSANVSFLLYGWNARFGAALAPARGFGTSGSGGFVAGAPGWAGDDSVAADGQVWVVTGTTRRLSGQSEISHGSIGEGSSRMSDGLPVGSAGLAVAGGGDVDGDGHDEILVGAPLWRERGAPGVGAAYVVRGYDPEPEYYGREGPRLHEAAATVHADAAIGGLGRHAAGGGDVDADGYDDVVLAGDGAVLLLYGSAEGLPDVLAASGADATFVSADPAAPVGGVVDGAGDVDGDGFDDLLLASPDGAIGVAWLVHGRAERFGPGTEVAAVGTKIGFETGTAMGVGPAVAGLDDVDGDGRDDFAVGVPLDGRAGFEVGAVYVFLGRADRRPAAVGLSEADAILTGPTADDCAARAGSAIAGRGDVNWDGLADFLVGAFGHRVSDPAQPCGGVYLVLGARS